MKQVIIALLNKMGEEIEKSNSNSVQYRGSLALAFFYLNRIVPFTPASTLPLVDSNDYKNARTTVQWLNRQWVRKEVDGYTAQLLMSTSEAVSDVMKYW